jgi:PKD repeat protein
MKIYLLKITWLGLFVIAIVAFVFTACKKEKSVFAVADFSFSGNVSATLPVTVQFTNSSIGLSYNWDFGDGNSSIEENPNHTYSQYGIYRVKLTARGTNNVDSMVLDIVIGGTLGQIAALNCASAQVNRTIKTGDVLSQHPILVPYTGGNGGVYNGQSIASIGVTGLTATLTAGNLSWGAGNLEYKLTGTPQSFGQAKFNLSIGGRTCELNLTVVDSGDYIPRNGLIGWWPFNGNANDASGNGLNGTVTGAALTTNRFGLANSAYLFNGVTNASTGIEVPLAINAGASFAISVWFMSIDSTKAAQTILVGWPYQSIVIGLNHPFFNNLMGSCIGNGSWQVCAPGMATTWNYTNKHDWHHIVMQYNAVNDVTTYYLDGGEVKSISHNFTYPQLTSISFGGQFQMSPSEVFKGVIDDAGVWNRLLSQQEIQALYSAMQ